MDGAYRRLVWSTKQIAGGAVSKSALQVFDVEGKYLAIFRVHGAAPIYVRLGPDSNPFVPIWSRMRFGPIPFTRVTFADGSIYGGALPSENYESRVLAVASDDPFVAEFPPREYGVKRNPYMRDDLLAGTFPTDLMKIVGPLMVSVDGSITTASTAGLEGATLLVLNTDATNNLYLCRTNGNDGAGGGRRFGPIVPGASLEIRFDDLPFLYPTTLDGCGLGFVTLAGTCAFSILLTRAEMNGAEMFQTSPSVSGIHQ